MGSLLNNHFTYGASTSDTGYNSHTVGFNNWTGMSLDQRRLFLQSGTRWDTFANANRTRIVAGLEGPAFQVPESGQPFSSENQNKKTDQPNSRSH